MRHSVAGVSLEIYIQVIQSADFKFHIQRCGGERDRQKERGKINVNLKIRKALIFH